MKYFFDTEFIDNGKAIELLSIGIISDDLRAYYAVSSEADHEKACPWVKKNVLPLLLGQQPPSSRKEIKEDIETFIGSDAAPMFWTYYGSYDWIAFCQLWGTMLSLPPMWPNLCMDVKQLAIHLGVPNLPKQETVKHHALNDAIWTKECYEFLTKRRVP